MQTTGSPRIDHVEVEPDTYGWAVHPVWAIDDGELDRPNTGGWVVGRRDLVDRLVAALMAGVVCEDPHVEVDVDGNTYVATTRRVLGRRMNADLRRLGF